MYIHVLYGQLILQGSPQACLEREKEKGGERKKEKEKEKEREKLTFIQVSIDDSCRVEKVVLRYIFSAMAWGASWLRWAEFVSEAPTYRP